MKHPAEYYKHPHHAAWQFGFDCAAQTNPYFTPGELVGETLDAYTAGYKYGEDSMDQYYDDQA